MAARPRGSASLHPSGRRGRARGPIEDVEAGQAFYAKLLPALDVGHVAAMWHIFTVGHLVAADLDRIARRFGLSIADLHLLGTLRIDRPRPLRATDLALTLHVSTAVLSGRIGRLAGKGLLVRQPSAADCRAFELTLTAEGAAVVDRAIVEIAHDAKFVRHFRRLPEADRAALSRVMGDLHERLDREFVATARGNG